MAAWVLRSRTEFLVYIPTGNPNPVGAGQSRKRGQSLLKKKLPVVALNPTQEMVWYFQSRLMTRTIDSTQAAVLFDGTWNGH